MRRYLLAVCLLFLSLSEVVYSACPDGGDATVKLTPATDVVFTNAEKTVTVKNSGQCDLTDLSVTITGTNKGDFSIAPTSSCQPLLAKGTDCKVVIAFQAGASGERSATLNITAKTTGVKAQLNLKATVPEKPAVKLSPTSVDFKNQAVNVASAEKTITLKNTGKADLTKIAISVTGTNKDEFTKTATGTCQSTLAPATECTITLTFKPKAGGPREAALSIKSNADSSPDTVVLKGTGVESPTVNLPKGPIDFKNQTVKVISAEKTVTLKNTGKADLTNIGISITGTNKDEFKQTAATTCQKTLAPATECIIGLTFTPKDLGAREALLTIKSNATTSPNSVVLQGNGIAPELPKVKLPASVDFKNQTVKVTSAEKTVTLKNTSKNVELTGIALAIEGTNKDEFKQTSATTCQKTLAPAAECVIGLTFTPKDLGAREATLTVKSNAENNPHSVGLKGNGIEPVKPTVKLPASVDFKNQAVKTTSAEKTITLKNSSKVELTDIAIAVSGTNKNEFAQSSTTCQKTLAAGAECTIGLTFTPKAAGAREATLTVKSNADGSPHTVLLIGNGTEEGVTIKVDPTKLDFGVQALNVASAVKDVTVMNTGAVNLKGIAIKIDTAEANSFAMTTTCTDTLMAGNDCIISITFTPTTPSEYKGTLIMTSNSPKGPHKIALTGLGEGAVVSAYPSLGDAQALDVAGKATTTQAKIQGGIAVDGGEFAATQDVKLIFDDSGVPTGQTVAVAGEIIPDPADVGQSVNLFVYAFLVYPGADGQVQGSYADCGDATKGGYYMLKNREALSIEAWDSSPSTLAALDSGVTLTESLKLAGDNGKPIYQGMFYAAGRLCLHFGYQLPDGKMVYNGQPINITVSPQ